MADIRRVEWCSDTGYPPVLGGSQLQCYRLSTAFSVKGMVKTFGPHRIDCPQINYVSNFTNSIILLESYES